MGKGPPEVCICRGYAGGTSMTLHHQEATEWYPGQNYTSEGPWRETRGNRTSVDSETPRSAETSRLNYYIYPVKMRFYIVL